MAAIGLAMTPPAIAQQTTSSVRGTIFSATGAPIEGATITVTHVPSGTRAVERTLPGGVFDVRGLRVGGPYTISVSAPSYTDEQLNGVMLTVGVPTRYDIALTPEAEAITVSAKVRTRLADPGSSTTIGRDEINTVTTMRRDIRDITRRDPLVTLDNVTRGTGPAGGIYIAGSTPRLNRITIDGVRSADDFGLNTGGLSTTRGPISMEAIEQLSVQAVPFDVAEGDFTGGAVNLVLRGGGNAFSGSAFVNYQNDGLFGEHVNGVRSSVPGQLQNYGGFLSGPIIKDKLFFAASYEYYRSLDPNAFQGPADLGLANLINGIGGSASGVPKLTTTDLAPVYTAWNSYATSSL
ncbi:MAG: carboxypeptidase regulatory-like domain-containing protein, partial [Hyphomonadaceae bacterium]